MVGIAGCGRMAGFKDRPRRIGPVWTHAQAYGRDTRFETVACMNPTGDHLRKFQGIWGIPRGYRTLGEMLEKEHLDVISLTSPSEFHAAQIQEILSSAHRPRLLFIEKPVCLRQDEGTLLEGQAEQSDVALVVNHTRRFDPSHQEVQDRIRAGTFGKLLEGHCLYYGGWLNNGVHLVDTLRMLFPSGDPSILSSRFSGHGRGEDADLNLNLRIGEAPVWIRSFDERYYQLFEMDLCFEQGRIQLLDAGFQVQAEQVKVNPLGERVLTPTQGFPMQGLTSPLAHAARGITKILAGKARASDWGVDLATALQTMEILWKAQECAGQPLEVVHVR